MEGIKSPPKFSTFLFGYSHFEYLSHDPKRSTHAFSPDDSGLFPYMLVHPDEDESNPTKKNPPNFNLIPLIIYHENSSEKNKLFTKSIKNRFD